MSHPDTEFFASAQVYLVEDLSQIVEGYVEFIKLKMWKPISRMISAKEALFQASYSILAYTYAFIP